MSDYLNYYQEKKVLVTGGAGAIGAILTRKLIDLKASVNYSG